jgi:peptide-methionine (S)-S-oxide reductase
MRVAKDGDTVEIHYTGTLEDGSVFDSSRKRSIPFSFTVGSGQVIPGFDEAVRGLSVGDSTVAVIPPERGYGKRDVANIISISRDKTPSDMDFSVGAKVPLSNGSSATVLEADDKMIKLDANHYLAGKTLTFDMELVGIVDNILGPPAAGLQRLVCAAGCFWGVELAFQRAPGVVSTRVGYTQGAKADPKYREVCSGSTGHTEAVAVDFDASVTSYEKLLELFWDRLGRSALTRNQAGNDVGTQYRSGIYFLNEEQRVAAQKSAKAVSEKLGKPVVTEIRAAEGKPFFLGEE